MKINAKTGALIWAAVILALCLLAILKQPTFATNIMALLPKSEQRPLVEEVQQSQVANYADHVFIMISAANKDIARLAVKDALSQLSTLKGLVSVKASVGDADMNTMALFPYRFALLSEAARKRLQSHQDGAQLQYALNQLFSPIGAGKADPIQDPFALYSERLQEQKFTINVMPENGFLRLTNTKEPSYLVVLTLKKDPFDLPVQAKIIPVLTSIKQQLEQQDVKVAYSGLLIHAARGTKQAKFEISTIGLGSLIGIILLILVIFRRIEALFQILIPVVVGCLVAMAVTALWFERVNLITIAFGAGLVGVAVDYSMHFVCESQIHNGHTVVRKLFMGLFLSLLSSVLAYGGLALTPFPGLQQIAVFSATGLIAAWLTVIMWLPLFAPKVKTLTLPLALPLNRWKNRLPKLDQHPYWATSLILSLLAITMGLVFWAVPQDNIRYLQTSPAALLKEDQSVQKALGNNTSPAFLMITDKQVESTLQEEEALREKLDAMVSSGTLDDYRAVTQSLPSKRQQEQNLALTNTLYQHQLNAYSKVLNLSKQQESLARDDLAQNQSILTLDKWLMLPTSAPWKSQFFHHKNGDVSTIIRLTGQLSQSTIAQLKDIAAINPHVDYSNQIEDISHTLAIYRIKMLDWLLIAYAIIALLLFLRYRRAIWRIMLPPVAGSVIALTIAVLIDGGYNLFNLIALMLVFGIGLDMGIFLQESRDGIHTWLAVSLSTATSLLAFGLLALSQTPVLYHFGIIVLPGLSLIWLLSPLMQATPQEKI